MWCLSSGYHQDITDWGGLSKRNSFLTLLEAGRVPAWLNFRQGYFPGLQMAAVSVCSHGSSLILAHGQRSLSLSLPLIVKATNPTRLRLNPYGLI